MRYRVRTERSIEADSIEEAVERFWYDVSRETNNQTFFVETEDGITFVTDGPLDTAILGTVTEGDN